MGQRAAVWVWVMIVLWVAGVAIAHLHADGLYPDERITVEHLGNLTTRYSLAATADSIARISQQHSPGYFWVLNGWARTVGYSQVALRYLSVLFGILSLALLYRLGARWYGRDVGVVAVGLLGTGALHIFYLHEMRMYSLLTLLLLWLLLQYDRVVSSKGQGIIWRDMLLLYASVVALLYTHYFSVFPLVGVGLYHLFFVRKDRRWWAVCGVMLAAGLTFLPWIGVVLTGTAEVGEETRAAMDALTALFTGGWLFANGQLFLMGVVLIGLGVYAYAEYRADKQVWLPVVVGAGTLACLLIANEALDLLPVRRSRYYLLVYPFLALMVARGLVYLPYQRILLPTIVGLFAASGVHLAAQAMFDDYTNRTIYEQADFPPFAEAITTFYSTGITRTPDDLLLFVSNTTPGLETFQPYIADFYGRRLNVQTRIIETVTFTNADRHPNYREAAESALATHPPVVYLAYDAEKTTDDVIATIDARLSEGYVPCPALADDNVFRLAVYVRDDMPCEIVGVPETAVRYQEESLALRGVVTSQNEGQLTVVTTWAALDEMPLDAYSYSLRVVSANEAYIDMRDAGIPLGVSSFGEADSTLRHTVMQFDTADWQAGTYELRVVVYAWQTGVQLTGMQNGETGTEMFIGRVTYSEAP